MKIWVIADTHFGHQSMIKHHNRPTHFDTLLVTNWNDRVRADDVVFHLGDIAFKSDIDLPKLVKRLNGRKILCLGHHDKQPSRVSMEWGFALACDYLVQDGVCFSHKPIAPLPPGATFNVHGHFHRDDHRSFEYAENDFFQQHREQYRLIQIEDSLSPVPIDQVVSGMSDRALTVGR